jgi:hypothetical protein
MFHLFRIASHRKKYEAISTAATLRKLGRGVEIKISWMAPQVMPRKPPSRDAARLAKSQAAN